MDEQRIRERVFEWLNELDAVDCINLAISTEPIERRFQVPPQVATRFFVEWLFENAKETDGE